MPMWKLEKLLSKACSMGMDACMWCGILDYLNFGTCDSGR